ncbi:unnamed protein product [Prorocentrum cordatum]|uniref:Uncharacterized protein n=1 Tax=Prorocentrum cordatum TaxID=2364126 RepID=A0ABN9T8B2_9DINO|nr:unnamed protein product [Polarella glacialis]
MFLNRRREHAASSELAALMSSPNQPLALRLRGRPHGEDAGSGGAQRVSQAPELSYLPRPKTGMRVQEERMEGRQEGRKERKRRRRRGGGEEEEGQQQGDSWRSPAMHGAARAPSSSALSLARAEDGHESVGLALDLRHALDRHEALDYGRLWVELDRRPVVEAVQAQLADDLEVLAVSAHYPLDAQQAVHLSQRGDHHVVEHLLALLQGLLAVLVAPLAPPLACDLVVGYVVCDVL